MKKLILVVLVIIGFASCTKDDMFIEPTPQVKSELQIQNSVGIKLETPFVTSEVSMNVKMETAGSVTIKIFDKTVQPDPLSVTVVEDIPKGLKLAIKYPL